MGKIVFPPVEDADPDGFLGVGGDLNVETLLAAYTHGVFPWPWCEEFPAWFAPPKRGVLFFKDLHVPRSLTKAMKKQQFEVKFNTAFKSVINLCAQSTNRGKDNGTWITQAMIDGYIKLHKAGYAYSVESYQDKKLVGGMYGVRIGDFVSGESMFYAVTNASKVALLTWIETLQQQGIKWLDCQMVTPHMKNFGAVEITRKKFLTLLNQAL